MRTGVPLCARERSVAHPDSSPVTEIIGECANLTVRNWLLAVPTIAVILIARLPILAYGVFADPRILSAIFSSANLWPSTEIVTSIAPAFWILVAFCAVLGVVLGIIAIGATYAGAGDVLRGSPVDLGGIVRRGAALFWSIVTFGLIVALIAAGIEMAVGFLSFALVALTGGGSTILVVLLFFCAASAAAFFLMYAIPSIVLGGLSPGDAIGQSFDLARENVGVTLILTFSLAVTGICAWISTYLLQFVSAIGPLASIVINGFFTVFQALIMCRFYLDLMSSASPPMVDSQS
jgi:hypothetical protein